MGADPLPEEAEALLPLGEECGLSARRAAAHMRRIADALDEWRTAARRNGIREQEITMMAESIDARLQAVRVAAS